MGFIVCFCSGAFCLILVFLVVMIFIIDFNLIKIMKFGLLRLGMKDYLGGGGLGGGIWSRVFFNCFRNVILVVVCFLLALCWWELFGKWCWKDTYLLLVGRLLILFVFIGVGRIGVGWLVVEYIGLFRFSLWGYNGVGWIKFVMYVIIFCRLVIVEDLGFECGWVDCWCMDCCCIVNFFRVWAVEFINFDELEFEDCDWVVLFFFGSSFGCIGIFFGGWNVEDVNIVDVFSGGGGGRFCFFLGSSCMEDFIGWFFCVIVVCVLIVG